MTDDEIVSDNILALQAIYFAQLLEDLKLFDVVDQLAKLFESGVLPIEDRDRAQRLFDDWRSARALVARAPRGDGEATPNRDFASLWLRFLSAVSSMERQPEPTAGAIQKQLHAAVALLSHPEIRSAAGVLALLLRSPAFRSLPPDTQQKIAHDTAKVADHLRDAIDFPDFVAGLIEGTFHAIVDASVQQMEAYAKLMHDLAESLERRY
jgi:hypothetical protein